MDTIRPFRWHNWPLFQRLAKQGLSLDVETGLVRGTGALRSIWLTSLLGDVGGRPAYVLHCDGDVAIGQLRHTPGDTHAYIAFIAPEPERGDTELWESLLEMLTVVAGDRGATNLIAEIEEGSPAYVGLRRVGFAIYARQEIWQREPQPVPGDTLTTVRPSRPEDAFNATVLYANVVPGLLRQIEPAPALSGRAFVLTEGDTLVGLITSQRGPQGSLLEAYLHPAAEHRTDEAIDGTLRHVDAAQRPVYFRVRRYQSWLGTRLADHGFTLLGQQAMMVKHTAARIQQHAYQALPAIEGGARASTPTPMVYGLSPPGGTTTTVLTGKGWRRH